MIQFSSTGTNKGCVWSCSIYNLAKLLRRSPLSILKLFWLQGSYLFKYFPENEKWSHRQKKNMEHLKMVKGVIKYRDQTDKKIQLPIQDEANCRMYHTYSW